MRWLLGGLLLFWVGQHSLVIFLRPQGFAFLLLSAGTVRTYNHPPFNFAFPSFFVATEQTGVAWSLDVFSVSSLSRYPQGVLFLRGSQLFCFPTLFLPLLFPRS